MTDWYAYPTNFSNGSSVDSAKDFFFTYPNFITGDGVAAGLLIIIWVLSFVISLSVGAKRGITAASFITLIFAVWFFQLGVINITVVFGLAFLMILGMILSRGEASY